MPKEGRFEFGFADGTLSDHEGEVAGRIGDLLRSLSPSQVFVTKPHDPHPDHQTLARATRRAVIDVYGSRPRPGPDGGREAIPGDHPNGSPPEVYTYRVYPGEGLWPDGHPSRATLVMTLLQLARSVFGLIGRRPLILRAARSRSDKTAAIEAYESQRKLLDGELRYVWRTGVELYRPMNMRSDPPLPLRTETTGLGGQPGLRISMPSQVRSVATATLRTVNRGGCEYQRREVRSLRSLGGMDSRAEWRATINRTSYFLRMIASACSQRDRSATKSSSSKPDSAFHCDSKYCLGTAAWP